jgi:hypothetical protein
MTAKAIMSSVDARHFSMRNAPNGKQQRCR